MPKCNAKGYAENAELKALKAEIAKSNSKPNVQDTCSIGLEIFQPNSLKDRETNEFLDLKCKKRVKGNA